MEVGRGCSRGNKIDSTKHLIHLGSHRRLVQQCVGSDGAEGVLELRHLLLEVAVVQLHRSGNLGLEGEFLLELFHPLLHRRGHGGLGDELPLQLFHLLREVGVSELGLVLLHLFDTHGAERRVAVVVLAHHRWLGLSHHNRVAAKSERVVTEGADFPRRAHGLTPPIVLDPPHLELLAHNHLLEAVCVRLPDVVQGLVRVHLEASRRALLVGLAVERHPDNVDVDVVLELRPNTGDSIIEGLSLSVGNLVELHYCLHRFHLVVVDSLNLPLLADLCVLKFFVVIVIFIFITGWRILHRRWRNTRLNKGFSALSALPFQRLTFCLRSLSSSSRSSLSTSTFCSSSSSVPSLSSSSSLSSGKSG
eukprot:m.175194 g.175194  ORF g.175194 m.175194 type:complete len:362 (-) comp24398_c0_seq2:567-1652(-)